MFRAWLVLLAVCCGAAWAAAPSYSAANIVNNGDYSPGPFAPNSILSVYGTDLAMSRYEIAPSDIHGNVLPAELNSTRVYIDNTPVALYFVSEKQINFLVPSKQGLGPAVVRVMREGWSGPEVTISITEAAPALLVTSDPPGYALASHRDFSVISPDAPAKPGEEITLWATGLGKTTPNPQPGELPLYVAEIVSRPSLKVVVGGTVVDNSDISYAGLAYGFAGLYQINFRIPDNAGADPEIRVQVGLQGTPAGLKLAIH
jgi:uncharacterized protein (TIGR03437 family)